MTDNTKKNTTTGEPVKEQAPATTEASTAPVSTTAETQPTDTTVSTTRATDTANSATPSTTTNPYGAAPVSTTEPAATPAKVEPPAYPVPHGIIIEGLPEGYLFKMSLLDENGVMYPEYIGGHAQEMAKVLKPLKASTFHRAFLTGAKEARKKKVPYSTKKNCAQGMVLQAMKLVNRKKDPAPKILLDMMKLVTATVVDDATFEALYVHLDAIETYMISE